MCYNLLKTININKNIVKEYKNDQNINNDYSYSFNI